MNTLYPRIDHGGFEGHALAARRARASRFELVLLVGLVALLALTTAGFTLRALQSAETSFQQAARV